MNTYSNPNKTTREIVEDSLNSIKALIDNLKDCRDIAELTRGNIIDSIAFGTANQHVNILMGAETALQNERVRLANIIAGWDGTEPEVSGTMTPTLPTFSG